ncbi:MAG: cytochrome b5-like heme/steroid binding domain-containing protein [Minisyncoccia bacterium]
MNYALFSLIGLFMFAITGIGIAEVKIQMHDEVREAAGTNESSIRTQDYVVEESRGDTMVTADATATVPEVLVQVAHKVETVLFSDWDEEGKSEDEDEDEREDEDDEDRDSTQTAPVTTSTMKPVTASQPTTTTVPIGTASVATFTMAEISSHNSATSCYSAINGSVYDLTSFVTKHPGGQAAIKSLCGIDGTAAYNSQHSGDRRATSNLANLKIGALK